GLAGADREQCHPAEHRAGSERGRLAGALALDLEGPLVYEHERVGVVTLGKQRLAGREAARLEQLEDLAALALREVCERGEGLERLGGHERHSTQRCSPALL